MGREYSASGDMAREEDLITIVGDGVSVRGDSQRVEIIRGSEVIFKGSYKGADYYLSARGQRMHYLSQVSAVIDKYPEIKELFFGIPSDETIWDTNQLEAFLSFLEEAHLHHLFS